MEIRMTSDVLVIGSGIAGASTALIAADAGLSVIVLNRAEDPEESNTRYAQGGIIWEGDEDSPTLLEHDIDVAGDEVGNLKAIEMLAEEGPSLVELFLIKRLQVPFDVDAQGRIHRTVEAAHSRPRIIHVADRTGWAIEKALTRELNAHPNIRILTAHTAIDLISTTHHAKKRGAMYDPTKIFGAYALDRKSGVVRTFLASRTVIATGGIGTLWRYTTNPDGARGDGIAMAERAGAHVINMEYMQFHPTAFRKEGCEPFLISEAVRGEGGILVNQQGEPFIGRYLPNHKELAPRDEVARAILKEIELQGIPHVWMDLRPIVQKGVTLEKRFPTIFEKCLSFGIDIRKDPIPVAPAAHYLCGGIRADEFGRTNLENLYAVGECSCTGLHGANRLASTSLLEGLVWGVRAAKHISGTFVKEDLALWQIPDWDESDVEEDQLPKGFAQYFQRLKDIMWEWVGMVRSKEKLERARRELSLMAIPVEEIYRRTKLSDELIGMRNAIQTTLLVTTHACRSKWSRGCHYREDERKVILSTLQ
ncbi:MAG: FAD-dependent oxidoreductase [candidate division NC10 bacterium]|nr:FAD-dependent oxidoreductase [candidate division NC10 bacterium]